MRASPEWIERRTAKPVGSCDRQQFNGNCLDWSTNSMGQTAGIGNEENTVSWSASGAVFCNTPMSLYCFEQ